MDKEFTAVSIPTSLYKKIEEAIQGTEVTSVASYVAKVLRESLSKETPRGRGLQQGRGRQGQGEIEGPGIYRLRRGQIYHSSTSDFASGDGRLAGSRSGRMQD